MQLIAATCGMGLTPSSASSACVSCDNGYFKNVPDNSTCLKCRPNTYSNRLELDKTTHCLPCPFNTGSVSGSVNCSCVPGFSGPDGGTCSQCVAGKYKNTSGPGTCTDCIKGTFSASLGANESLTCLQCPTRSDAPVASATRSACTCNAGSTGANGETCSLCTPGKYKLAAGNGVCVQCIAGTYSAVMGASGCTRCHTHADSLANRTACACIAGYSLTGGRCMSCGTGMYLSTASKCVQCEAGKYSDIVAATRCRTCPPNHFRLQPGASKCALCSEDMVSIPDHTGCRTPPPCPGWNNSMVDAATAALVERKETDEVDSFYVFESFIAHYARQPEGGSTSSCTKLYDRVIERMRTDAGGSAATTLAYTVDVGILTLGLFTLQFRFNLNS